MSQKHADFTIADTAWVAGSKAFLIFQHEAGYKLDTIYGHHEIVVAGDLDGGTYDVEIMAPRQDVWRPFAVGQDADSTVVISQETVQGIKVVFSGVTPVPLVHLTSRLRGI